MHDTHGRIYTWTFKGEVFIRKDAENAPKRKILSEEYLLKLSKGDISLDIPDETEVSYASQSVVIIEEVMAATSSSVASD